MVVAIARWLLNPADSHGWCIEAFSWFGCLRSPVWSLLVRLALRRGLFLPDISTFVVAFPTDERSLPFFRPGQRVPRQNSWSLLSPQVCRGLLERRMQFHLLVALSSSCRRDS